MTNALAFAALADPTRREVFERLARGPQAVGDLARGLPVSRPAVSQHLKVLKEAGLVTDQPDGARRVYQIDPQGLGQIRAWLDRFWDTALDAFKAEVERDPDDDANLKNGDQP
jgi:DNA-binding transcriptional ArsR family regulator